MKTTLAVIFILQSMISAAWAGSSSCASLFAPVQSVSKPQKVSPLPIQDSVPEKEDPEARPRSSPWIRFYKVFERKTRGQENPFVQAGLNADEIGLVQREFRKVIRNYASLIKLSEESEVSYEVYKALTQEVAPNLLAMVKNNHGTMIESFAALEASRIMSLIESRTVFPKDAKDKKSEEEKKKEEDKEQEEDDFRWNDNKQEYEPDNKDISSEGKGKKPVIILRTNAHVIGPQLYRQEVFDVINPTEIRPNGAIRPVVNKSNPPKKIELFTRLGLFGSDRVLIPIQYGYEPVVGNYKDFRVVEAEPDIYYAEVLVEGLKEVQIPLIQKRAQSFKSSLGDRPYRDSTGIPKSEWPADILNFVEMNKGQSPLDIAKKLEKFLSKDGGYLYFSKGDLINEAQLNQLTKDFAQLKTQYATPVAMARLKSFNCDGAAWIGASILKDFFSIPARIATGRTSAGKERSSLEIGAGGGALSVIRSTDPLHAWVEVWDGSKWVAFDMTPKLNNPQMSREKSDLEQHEREEVSPDSGKPSEPKDKSSDSKESGDGKDAKSKESEDKESDKSGKDERSDKGESKEDTEVRSQNIEARDSQSKAKLKEQYLIYKVFEVLKSWSTEMLLMDPNRKGTKSLVTATLRILDTTDFTLLDQDALRWFHSKESEIFDRKDESLSQKVSTIKIMSSDGKLREAYLELKSIEMLIKSIAENRKLTTKEDDFLIAVQDSLRVFQSIKHKNSAQYDLVDRTLRKLPGPVSRQLVREKYGQDLDQIDSLSMQSFANDLARGNLQALIRSALLKNFVDMVLNSDKIPRYKDEKTLYRSPSPKPTQDLVMATSALELPKMLLNPKPGEHIFADLVRGQQFAIGSREITRVQDPKTPLERKVSRLYYDISPSMNENRMKIQDSFLMTYVDRALTDVDFFGNPMHEVYLIPFSTVVHEESSIHVKSLEDAKRFIAKMINYNHKTKNGTEIEPVLLDFYSAVAVSIAEKAQGKKTKLHKANLVLVTDGGAEVNMEKIIAARKKIPAEVQINMNFLAIEDTNPTLVELAQSSNMSTTKPMYRHITRDMINEIISESERPLVDQSAFAQVESFRATPELVRSLNAISGKIADFKIQPKIQDIQKKLAEFRVKNIDHKKLPNIHAPAELIQLQRVLVNLDLPTDIKIRIVYVLLYEYENYSRRKLTDVLLEEQEAFQALYEWARN